MRSPNFQVLRALRRTVPDTGLRRRSPGGFRVLCRRVRAEDSKAVLRQALRNDTRNRGLERSYTYTLREETRKLDSGNAVRSTESKAWGAIPLAGGPRSAANYAEA